MPTVMRKFWIMPQRVCSIHHFLKWVNGSPPGDWGVQSNHSAWPISKTCCEKRVKEEKIIAKMIWVLIRE